MTGWSLFTLQCAWINCPHRDKKWESSLPIWHHIYYIAGQILQCKKNTTAAGWAADLCNNHLNNAFRRFNRVVTFTVTYQWPLYHLCCSLCYLRSSIWSFPYFVAFFWMLLKFFKTFFVVSFCFIYLPGYSSQVSVHQALRDTIDYGCHTWRTKPFKLTASQYFIQRRLILRILGGRFKQKTLIQAERPSSTNGFID